MICRLLLFLVMISFTLTEGESSTTGEIVLRWTAPGDNGYIGQAAGYNLRYHASNLGPINTEVKFAAANPISGLPYPSPAGRKDSVIITGLQPGGSYYFCLKTYDAAGNYSGLSNSPLRTAGNPINCPYNPGDANGDEQLNILDIIFLIRYLYKGGPPPVPFNNGDANASGSVNIQDINYLIAHLYKQGPAPVCRF